MHPCSSRNCKTMREQNWRSKNANYGVGSSSSLVRRCLKPKISDYFFDLQLQPPAVLQPLKLQRCIVSGFETPDIGIIDFFFVKGMAALLRHLMFTPLWYNLGTISKMLLTEEALILKGSSDLVFKSKMAWCGCRKTKRGEKNLFCIHRHSAILPLLSVCAIAWKLL